MKGLSLLLPILSSVFALTAYVLSANIWLILAAFFLAGPVVIVLLGIFLGRRPDETDSINKSAEP